tara:strand:- start:4243 stop:6417 length:2175 start_codon:yes stop_codon:yes gene_type:complete
MADESIPTDVENNINKSIDDGTPKRRTRRNKAPSYKVVGESKIPVAKAQGTVWKSRKNSGIHKLKRVEDAWRESMRYYDNDQTNHRLNVEGGSGNILGNQKLNDNITETENVVFANVTTMVPALYARNPQSEFTSTSEKYEKLATTLERLVNVLLTKKVAPGLNLKPKAKRTVVTSLLTNRCWLQLGWVFKDDSSEKALEDLQALAKQLEKAKTKKKIEEVEGKIMALEATIDILTAAGPTLKYKSPFDVIVDPDSEEIDLGDAKWVMVRDFLPTTFITAKYGKKKRGSDQFQSIYQPSHVMKVSAESDEGHDDADAFNMFKEDDQQPKDYGFTDEEAFNKAKRTEVWMVWDKVTRRVLMYNAKDWTWPIWVWDDPLQLDRFFNVYGLMFFDSPQGSLTKGETSYYLDQQDAINEMVDEETRARRWARRNVVFDLNSGLQQEDVEAVLSGDDGTVRGVKVPDGKTLNDVISSITPPSYQFKDLFNKESKYQAIDRISSVGAVLRGEQFKTNTNKQNAQITTQAQNMRVDEKSDMIEDWIGDISWGVAQLCLINMKLDVVVRLIGDELAANWQNMSPEEISSILSMQVLGGSTKKPTSQAKKEEALEMGQVLGQFVNAAPQAVTRIMIEVFQQAFDEVIMKDENWEELKQEIIGASQQQQVGPEGQTTNTGGQTPIDESQVDTILAQLPTDLKQAVAQSIQQGADPVVALQEAMAVLEQPGSTQQ